MKRIILDFIEDWVLPVGMVFIITKIIIYIKDFLP